MKTIWHPHAEADLENLISYTAKEFPLTASRWLEMIRKQANLLSTAYTDEAGHPVEAVNPAGLGLLCGVFFDGQC